jgi:hypothetical protein
LDGPQSRLAASSSRERSFGVGEAAALAAGVVAVLGYYFAAGFPIYNNATWLDPWYYTALFFNFRFLYTSYTGAYYSSRLPWLIPGRVINAVFSPTAAYFILHIVYGVLATAALYLLIRRLLGRAPAVVTAAAAVTSPVYYHALYRDYVNTGVLTYLLVGAWAGLAARGGRRPVAAMAACGFFLVAAVTTHFYAGLLAAALVVPYAILFRPTLSELARDGLGFIAGGALLFGICGFYAKSFGRSFNFIHPQIVATGYFHSANFKRPGVAWMASEPRVLLPFFLVVTAVAFLLPLSRGSRITLPRGVTALTALAAVVYGGVLIWELAGKGIVLEWLDYFELSFALTVLPLVGVVAWALFEVMGRAVRPWATALAVVALAAPPFVLYRFDWSRYTGRSSMLPSIVLMLATVGVALALAAIRRRKWSHVAAVVAAVGVGLGVAYPTAASTDIESNLNASATVNRVDSGIFDVGVQWLRWMQASDLQDQHMVTWYDAASAPTFNGVASLYYWGWILQGTDMPRITPEFRRLWRERDPDQIVLLCSQPTCEGAPAALRRAGYAIKPRASRPFTSGPVRLWVRIFSVSRTDR